jgi:predicted transcriptional regulator
MTDAEKKVLQAMKKAGKPMRPGEVAEATGLDKDEVSKAIQALKKAGQVASPKRCFWEPA